MEMLAVLIGNSAELSSAWSTYSDANPANKQESTTPWSFEHIRQHEKKFGLGILHLSAGKGCPRRNLALIAGSERPQDGRSPRDNIHPVTNLTPSPLGCSSFEGWFDLKQQASNLQNATNNSKNRQLSQLTPPAALGERYAGISHL
ncbi:hypothetical protein CIHG_04232 [Coccidioides immitis H538.4]|uniref:Uncharacterized protein n=3 Tax=Coccidioides immitis TaxID=5501 RepID=A0A0J8R1E9_COCIT|nr:hypothetical protein CIRG_04621 [Coccidioides immitis RMSCC 2394]KMU78135.1 hypothetical protein CISG_06976 [Coccidioides immitis RMSCC 3703]KMU86443.1 hypothetical protein CIHG_04232 [Coccidioides immitis H538.4]